MRRATLCTLAAATVLLLAPASLLAQDSAAPVVTDDSLTDTLSTDTSDIDAPRHAVMHGARGSNPYLREVGEERRGSARRGGYYASFGVGAGSEAIAALETPSPFAPSRIRPTLNIGIGVNVAPALRVGLDAFGWFNIANDGALETVTTAMLTARVYPMPVTGLYLRAGAGFGRYGLDLYSDACGCNNYSVHDFGLAYSLGGGFEVPVGGGLNLGPSIEMIRFNVEGPDGYRERVLNLGLTLTFDSHH
jgi:hypothetical protein